MLRSSIVYYKLRTDFFQVQMHGKDGGREGGRVGVSLNEFNLEEMKFFLRVWISVSLRKYAKYPPFLPPVPPTYRSLPVFRSFIRNNFQRLKSSKVPTSFTSRSLIIPHSLPLFLVFLSFFLFTSFLLSFLFR